ncbi:hypothetical protein ABEF93_002287 [Exophiala dermatitidis]
MFEARCAPFLEAQVPYFIRGEASAPLDAGLLLTDVEPDWSPSQDRLSQAIRRFGAGGANSKNIVPLDFKTINPRLAEKLQGHPVGRKPGETRLGGHAVARLPSEGQPSGRSPGKREYRALKLEYFGQDVEPFPVEWWPFVMPLDALPQALRSLQRLMLGKASSWTNPYNNIEFPDPELPCPVQLGLLHDPQMAPVERTVQCLKAGFAAHSSRYGVERLAIRDGPGHFGFVDIRHEDCSAVVKIKHGILDVRLWPQPGKDPFSPFAQWDWLLATDQGQCSAVLIPRDRVPQKYFVPQADPDASTGPLSLGSLDAVRIESDRRLDTGQAAPAGVVKAMERILDDAGKYNKLRAQRHTSVVGTLLPVDVEVGPDVDSDSECDGDEFVDETKAKSNSKKVWGNKFFHSGYARRQGEMLRRLCEADETCSVWPLGAHPSASHVFAMGNADSLVELHPDTPMVYLNFADIDAVQREAMEKRRFGSFMNATHGLKPSIYLLNPVPEELDHLPHQYFLVPSTTLATENLRQRNEAYLKARDNSTVGSLSKNARPLELKYREPLDVYAVDGEHLKDTLQGLMRRLAMNGTTLWGDAVTGLGAEIHFEDFVTTQREVVEQCNDMPTKRKFGLTQSTFLDDPAYRVKKPRRHEDAPRHGSLSFDGQGTKAATGDPVQGTRSQRVHDGNGAWGPGVPILDDPQWGASLALSAAELSEWKDHLSRPNYTVNPRDKKLPDRTKKQNSVKDVEGATASSLGHSEGTPRKLARLSAGEDVVKGGGKKTNQL